MGEKMLVSTLPIRGLAFLNKIRSARNNSGTAHLFLDGDRTALMCKF